MAIVGLRGATTASENSESAILAATRELLSELVRLNRIEPHEIVSAFFSMTPDLDAAFPARAARDLGWDQVALLDLSAPRVRGDLARCIRVLIHLNAEAPTSLHPVYLGAARALRPDLPGGVEAPGQGWGEARG